MDIRLLSSSPHKLHNSRYLHRSLHSLVFIQSILYHDDACESRRRPHYFMVLHFHTIPQRRPGVFLPLPQSVYVLTLKRFLVIQQYGRANPQINKRSGPLQEEENQDPYNPRMGACPCLQASSQSKLFVNSRVQVIVYSAIRLGQFRDLIHFCVTQRKIKNSEVFMLMFKGGRSWDGNRVQLIVPP